jgi:hypothetical protein
MPGMQTSCANSWKPSNKPPVTPNREPAQQQRFGACPTGSNRCNRLAAVTTCGSDVGAPVERRSGHLERVDDSGDALLSGEAGCCGGEPAIVR